MRATPFDTRIEYIQTIEANHDAFIIELIKELEEVVLQLNKNQLKEQGVDSEGHELGEYRPLTISIRSAYGLQTDYIDLSFEGDYQDSFAIEYGQTEFTIIATDPKTETIEKRFKKPRGLTEGSKAELKVFLRDLILEKLRKRI